MHTIIDLVVLVQAIVVIVVLVQAIVAPLFAALATSTQGWIMMLVTMYAGLLSCIKLHDHENGTLHLLSSCFTQHTWMSYL